MSALVPGFARGSERTVTITYTQRDAYLAAAAFFLGVTLAMIALAGAAR